jgi:hypothetical protein
VRFQRNSTACAHVTSTLKKPFECALDYVWK